MIKKYSDKVMKQNQMLFSKANKDGHPEPLYQMYLLFEDKADMPDSNIILTEISKVFGKSSISERVDGEITSFSLDSVSKVAENNSLAPQLMITDYHEFDQKKITPEERLQFWNVPNRDDILSKCKYNILISDCLSFNMPYRIRCDIISRWLDICMKLFPQCKAVWFIPSGNLLTAEQVKKNPYKGDLRFLQGGLNVRIYKLEGTEGILVDTLGLYSIGLPDVQYCFKELNHTDVMLHAAKLGAYIYENNSPIKDGDTIEGFICRDIKSDVQWKCQKKQSLLTPKREVINVVTDEFAVNIK